ncbi:MAG: HK97 gp10 family phage protein [Mobiluncus sp.]|nr:HK97 gp10 family phage protein [Mobiluncus sp.]
MSRMKKAVGTLEDLQPALQKISQYGGKQLKARTPVRSGNLKGTVKTRKRARKATVSIGTKRFYYGPFVNYGTRHMAARNFTLKAKQATYPYAQFVFNTEIKKQLRKYGMT